MPQALKTHRPPSLKPHSVTLKARQGIRTLALNGKAWAILRRVVLDQQPLCIECKAQGYVVLAREVDHIDNDASNNLRDNLQGLCTMHHSQKTGRETARNRQQPSAAKRAAPDARAAALPPSCGCPGPSSTSANPAMNSSQGFACSAGPPFLPAW